MRKFYYAFEWIVRPMGEIWLLIHKDNGLDYDLALMNYGMVWGSEIISLCFIIGVDSEEALQGFQNKVGLQLDVSNWRISSQSEFDRGNRFPEGLLGGYGEWLWDTMVVGRNNMPRIDKFASQSDDNHFDYFVCYWLITDFGLDRFSQVHATSEKLGLLLYQFHPTLKEDCYCYKLGIRIPSPTEDLLQEFIKEVESEIGLTDWQPIKDDEFYDGVKFAYNYNVENFIEANRKHAAQNKQLGCI